MEAATDKQNHGQGRFYHAVTSVKTTMAFLAVFAFLFFLAALFPQSADPNRLKRYGEAGGGFVTLVGSLDLLGLFRSWYFTLVVALFMFHLALCCAHRLNLLPRRHTSRMFTRDDLLQHGLSLSVACPTGIADLDVEQILGRLGLKQLKYYSEDAHTKRIVCERGLPFRWLSWSFHVFLLIAVGGFFFSHQFASEDKLTIAIGERKTFELRPQTTMSRGVLGLFGHPEEAKPRQIEIKLESFQIDYAQGPALQYPGGPAGRFLAAWGLGGKAVRYRLTDDSLYPRNWHSILGIYKDGRLVLSESVEANAPLRYEGITFYQLGYRHIFDLNIGEETLHDILAEAPFTIPQMEGEFVVKTPRIGSLLTYDGAEEKLEPSAIIHYRPPAGQGECNWNTVGKMIVGRPVEVMHAKMALNNVRQSSVLGCRHTPGRPLIGIIGALVAVLMVLRICLPWYQVHCHADGSSGRTLVTSSIKMVGLFARPERLAEALRAALLK